MSLLSTSEMAAIRATAESGFITPVTIQRRTLVVNDYGSQEQYTTIATVDGWMTEVTPNGTGLTEVGGVQAVPGNYRLFVPVGTDIRSADLVTLGGLDFVVQHTDEGGSYLPFLTIIMQRAD